MITIKSKRVCLKKVFLSLIMVVGGLGLTHEVNAADYTVNNVDELKYYLELPTSDNITVASGVSYLDLGTMKISIQANKVLNLNQGTLNATTGSNYARSGGIALTNSVGFTNFTIKNGKLTGGSSAGLGSRDSLAGFISAVPEAVNLKVLVQDITHNDESAKGSSTASSFFKGRRTDIEFRGKIRLYNGGFNVRALNVKMYANPNDPNDPENTNFYGYAFKNKSSDQYTNGEGGVNISFDGHAFDSYKDLQKITKNVDIPRNAYVELKNETFYSTGDLQFANNIANFAQINLDGTLIAEAEGTPIRTTAAYDSGVVGTKSDRSELNINPGSIFDITALNPKSDHSVIYSYVLDTNIDNPKIFDMKNYGTKEFFWSWSNRNGSNLRIKNTDIAVWPIASKSLGMPSEAWSNVDSLTVTNYVYGQSASAYKGLINTGNTDIQNKFYPDSFSRISNNVNFPEVIPGVTTIGNNETVLSGSTDYTSPGGEYINRRAVNATVTMKVGNITKTTVTDYNGNWSFSGLDLTKIPGGSKISLTIVDSDKLIQKNTAIVDVVDKISPKASAKVVKTLLNDYAFIQTPTLGLINMSDETTPIANLLTAYVDSLDVLKEKANSLGVKELPIMIKDTAQNETLVKSQLLVTDNPAADGLIIVGNDFTMDYDVWMSMSAAERRKEIILKGDVRAWAVKGNVATEVTNDEQQFFITYPTANWQPKDIVKVTMKVGNYSKIINVTLSSKEVNADISYSDQEDKEILGKTSQVLKSGESYNISPEKIPGFEVVSATVDSKPAKLNTDKSVTVVAGASNINVRFVYQSIHFKLSMSVDKSSVMPGDPLVFTLNVKSGMVYPDSQPADNYLGVEITLPIDDKLSDIRDIQVINSDGVTVGTGQYDEPTKKISVTLMGNIKNTEDFKVIYTGTVKTEANVGETVVGDGVMLASYQVNGATRLVESESNNVYATVKGGLTIISKPATIDFGKVSYLAKKMTVDNPKYVDSLIISDTRDSTVDGWTVSATLLSPLTANGQELSGKMIYRLNKKDLELSKSAQTIYVNNGTGENQVNITDTWGSTPESDGLKLKFTAEDEMMDGHYSGTIRWTLMAGQP